MVAAERKRSLGTPKGLAPRLRLGAPLAGEAPIVKALRGLRGFHVVRVVHQACVRLEGLYAKEVQGADREGDGGESEDDHSEGEDDHSELDHAPIEAPSVRGRLLAHPLLDAPGPDDRMSQFSRRRESPMIDIDDDRRLARGAAVGAPRRRR
jgi:hypothetical protein